MNCAPVAITSHSSSSHNSAATVNPLCIILVKNGSKGDRLLFRYPYSKKVKTIGSDGTLTAGSRSKIGTDESLRNTSFTSSGSRSGGGESNSSPGVPESSKGTGGGISTSDLTEASSYATGSKDNADGRGFTTSTNSTNTASTAEIPTIYTSTPSPLMLLGPKSPAFIGTTTKSLFDTPLSTKSFTSPQPGSGSNLGSDFGINLTRLRKVSRTTAPVISRGDGENPYSVSKNPNDDLFCEPGFAGRTTSDGRKFSLDGSEMLAQLSDKDLSNLLAVNSDLAERKFELKLNFVRFVGHPTLMHNPKDVRPINPM